MAFQFLCPQGHLLQADPSQMGRTINCPTCGVLFVVPTLSAPSAAPTVVAVPPAPPPAPPPMAEPPEQPEQEDDDPLNISLGRRRRRHAANVDLPAGEESASSEPAASSSVETDAEFDPMSPAPRMVHIVCPKGHVLVTPRDTMGDEVLCPHCGELFVLRYEASREYKQRHQRKEEAAEQKLGNRWLMWSIFVGVLVLGMLGALAFLGSR